MKRDQLELVDVGQKWLHHNENHKINNRVNVHVNIGVMQMILQGTLRILQYFFNQSMAQDFFYVNQVL